MPIPVACKCGQKFAAKDELAGKATKCPKCGQPLQIPQPKPVAAARPAAKPAVPARPAPKAALADLFDEAGLKVVAQDTRPRCPSCKEPLAANAILCVACGYNLETGRLVKGANLATHDDAKKYGVEQDGHGNLAVSVLKKAERDIQADKVEEFRIRTQGAPAWALAIIFLVITTFAACMSLSTTDVAMRYTAIVMGSSSIVVACIYGSLVRRTAFKDSLQEGLLCMLVPFYEIYYVATHWKECGKHFMISLICVILFGISIGLAIWSADFKPDPNAPQKMGRATSLPSATLAAASANTHERIL